MLLTTVIERERFVKRLKHFTHMILGGLSEKSMVGNMAWKEVRPSQFPVTLLASLSSANTHTRRFCMSILRLASLGAAVPGQPLCTFREEASKTLSSSRAICFLCSSEADLGLITSHFTGLDIVYFFSNHPNFHFLKKNAKNK